MAWSSMGELSKMKPVLKTEDRADKNIVVCLAHDIRCSCGGFLLFFWTRCWHCNTLFTKTDIANIKQVQNRKERHDKKWRKWARDNPNMPFH